MVKVRYKSLYWRREKEWFSSDIRVYIGEEKKSDLAQIKEFIFEKGRGLIKLRCKGFCIQEKGEGLAYFR